jgi:hypothetical protein
MTHSKDMHAMTAAKVSKLISTKMNNRQGSLRSSEKIGGPDLLDDVLSRLSEVFGVCI